MVPYGVKRSAAYRVPFQVFLRSPLRSDSQLFFLVLRNPRKLRGKPQSGLAERRRSLRVQESQICRPACIKCLFFRKRA